MNVFVGIYYFPPVPEVYDTIRESEITNKIDVFFENFNRDLRHFRYVQYLLPETLIREWEMYQEIESGLLQGLECMPLQDQMIFNV